MPSTSQMCSQLSLPEGIMETPWDSRIFGFPTFEILTPTQDCLTWPAKHAGHYTLRIPDIYPAETIKQYGFFYVDTLIEPWVDLDHFKPAILKTHDVSVERETTLTDEVRFIAENVFIHDRYHKDPTIPSYLASRRYSVWTEDILRQGGYLFSLRNHGKTVGFFAGKNNKIILHGLNKAAQGLGLSKEYWTICCSFVFQAGFNEMSSSISASNVPVLNLYASLGFRFRNAKEIYHLRTY